MRIAVLSDIHGNLPALEAVLAALKPYDAVWELGDICGYGPQPDEVVARLAAEGAIGVRGNHDSAAIGLLDTDAFNDDARTAVEWTADRIAPRTRDWLSALPLRVEKDSFTLVHGSPRDPTWEYVLNTLAARLNFTHFRTPYCFVGHSHIQSLFEFDEAEDRVISTPNRISEPIALTRRAIANPGSVGQPRDRDPRAAYAIFDTGARTWESRRVDYDIAVVQKRIRDAGLPPRHALRLAEGW